MEMEWDFRGDREAQSDVAFAAPDEREVDRENDGAVAGLFCFGEMIERLGAVELDVELEPARSRAAACSSAWRYDVEGVRHRRPPQPPPRAWWRAPLRDRAAAGARTARCRAASRRGAEQRRRGEISPTSHEHPRPERPAVERGDVLAQRHLVARATVEIRPRPRVEPPRRAVRSRRRRAVRSCLPYDSSETRRKTSAAASWKPSADPARP